MKKKKLAAILLALLSLSLIVIGCSNAQGEEAAGSASAVEMPSNDSLVIGISNTIDSMNPFYAQGMQSTYAQRFIYESLLNMTGPTSFEPRLGDITTEDNETFTVTLNDEARWTDGEPVTSEDVAFTLNTIAHPDTLTSLGNSISMLEGTDESGKFVEADMTELPGVEIIDDYTLELHTKYPTDLNKLSELLGFKVLIAPEHVFGEIPKADLQTSAIVQEPEVTNGAYTFVEQKESNYVHVAANPDYYRGAPKIQNVFVRYVAGTSMLTELEAGNVHMLAGSGIAGISHNDADLLRDSDHINVDTSPGTRIQYLVPNTQQERFQDPRVRQALSYAIDKEIAVEHLLLGNGEVSAGPYPSVSDYVNKDVKPFPYDPEKAKQLLDEANFDFSQPVELVVPTGNAPREQMGDIIQQQLEAVGMTVNQVNYDFATTMSETRQGNFDLVITGKLHSYDPDISAYYATDATGNTGFYSDEKMDALIAEGNAGTSVEERLPVYDELQEYFVEELPVVPLYVEDDYRIQSKHLKGGVAEFFEDSLSDAQDFEFVQSEEGTTI